MEEDVYAHIFQGDRFDTGNLASYLEATVEFALKDKRTEAIMKDIIKKKGDLLSHLGSWNVPESTVRRND